MLLNPDVVRESSIAFLLKLEGGYVNDVNDSGKETNFGISKKAYPNVDIKNLTADAATQIYRADYWARVSAGALPPPLAIHVFDHGVNAGVNIATELLQAMVGTKVDGKIGPQTIAATHVFYNRDPHAALKFFVRRRLDYYKSCKTWPIHGAGWAKRTSEVQSRATTWVLGLQILSQAGLTDAP